MPIRDLSADEIVARLETNESRQFTEAAHAEMMRRFIIAGETHGRRMFWLTITIVALTTLNAALTLVTFITR